MLILPARSAFCAQTRNKKNTFSADRKFTAFFSHTAALRFYFNSLFHYSEDLRVWYHCECKRSNLNLEIRLLRQKPSSQ